MNWARAHVNSQHEGRSRHLIRISYMRHHPIDPPQRRGYPRQLIARLKHHQLRFFDSLPRISFII